MCICLCVYISLLFLHVTFFSSSLLHVYLFCACSAISVELYYIFATLWGREQFALYGILFVVYIILLSVTACVAVALTYFQLSGEDHRWWWRSIFSAGLVHHFIERSSMKNVHTKGSELGKMGRGKNRQGEGF